MSHCQILSVLLLVLIFIFDSLLLFSPLCKLYGLSQLYYLCLESRDLVDGASLHVVYVGIHDCPDGWCRGQVRTVNRFHDWEGASVGVWTDHVRFDRLILSVDQDLLPWGEHSVKGIVASVDQNTVFVELLNLLDCRQISWLLPVKLANHALADGQEGHFEVVAE